MKSRKQKQLARTLRDFYTNPITQVSIDGFLSVGLILFFAIFAIRPTLLKVSELVNEIQQKREFVDQLDEKISILQHARSEYGKIKDDVIYIDEAIPDSPQLVNTLKVIEKVASGNEIPIKSISVAMIPPEKETDFTKLDRIVQDNLILNVSIAGDYQSIKQVINDLLLYRRSFYIEQVTFKTDEGRRRRINSEAKSLTAIMVIKAPYFVNK